MKELFDKVAFKTSKMVTRKYSTSFSLGIYFLDKKFHDAIYAIYGFVRFADEIVDTFHDYDKESLLLRFKEDTYRAIQEGISLNPVLHSFQKVVNQYNIDLDLIETFLQSMEMDLYKHTYTKKQYERYILGSAEVVGLMCLKVFVEGDQKAYEELKYYAMKLGSAFQKINFLRDLNADYFQLGRVYFPGVDMSQFDYETKQAIEKDIEIDFALGFEGIRRLPKSSRLGVYVAYVYYYQLFQRIKNLPPAEILNKRIRIPNNKKIRLLFKSYIKHALNLL
ncbi:phytoene synthase [Thermaurantimonas aggregans]|uniref:Phytoene synthase n=1 Tax=Thermaurantimonas aggregans TaxID=2173829 RepID=A0A401XNG2_9FLAO|nr:phytoene/squalene synthase family protein [Thermaurantimonas aggregans]GCD78551.1 phytoene synthase [Thermaurantimonas aggregans]